MSKATAQTVEDRAYFLLKCEADSSYTLAPEKDVVYIGPVAKEDEVSFMCKDSSGKMKKWSGIIEAFGRADDYTKLAKLQEKLNKRRGKEPENTLGSKTGRKSANIAKSKISASAPTSKKTPAQPKQQAKPKPIRGRIVLSSDDENADDPVSDAEGKQVVSESSNSDDSAASELTEEEKLLMKKLEAKQKKRDLKLLQNLSSSNAADATPVKQDLVVNKETEESLEELEDGASGSGHADELFDKEASGDERVVESPPAESEVKETSSSKSAVMVPRKRKPSNPSVFEGTMWKVSKTDKDAQELWPNSNVFILKPDLETVRSRATSASACARQLMGCIFTDEALDSCSLAGNIAFGKGKDLEETRPGLASEGVDAIFLFSKSRQKKKVEYKKWKEMDDTTIKTRMRNLLCERRMKMRKSTGT